MTSYEAVLSAALDLPQDDQLRLLDRLWETVPEDEDAPFSEEWKQEIEQRVAELKAGSVKTIPWSEIRDRMKARLDQGQTD